MRDMKLTEGEFRVIVPGGCVDINVSLNDADGNPVVRVDVVPDAPRFGPDKDGRSWEPVNGEAGVVRLVGKQPLEVDAKKYTMNEWEAAFEAAQLEGFDWTDVQENAPALSLTMVEAFNKRCDDEYVVQAAVDAANKQFGEWSIEQFNSVVDSYLRSVYGNETSAKPWEEVAVYNELSQETYFFKRVE